MKAYIVAGIGTEVGKTVISAMLVEGLEADYWKPVQAGDLHHTDTDKVKKWVSNPHSKYYPEAFRLTQPMSPHAAAEIDGLEILAEQIHLPETDNTLIVELAGGLMVPINNRQTNMDLISQFDLPVILVANYYLGSINHTLLSIEMLQGAGFDLAGLIFSGKTVSTTRDIILDYTDVDLLGEIPKLAKINPAIIHTFGVQIASNLSK